MAYHYKNKSAKSLIFRQDILELTQLEQTYHLKIPPIYRSFIKTFEDLRGEILIDETTGEFLTLSYYVYIKDDGDIHFEDFLPIEQSLKVSQLSDSWIENDVMPIGQHSHGGAILIGLNERNKDKIYFEHEAGVEFIEENIYSFVKNLQFVRNDEISTDQIYKLWGEDFWRTKKTPYNKP